MKAGTEEWFRFGGESDEKAFQTIIKNLVYFPEEIKSGVVDYFSGELDSIHFPYQEEFHLKGEYLGRICSKCSRTNCKCCGYNVEKIHSFTPFTVKKTMLKPKTSIKIIILYIIHRKVKCVKFMQNICFESLKTKEMFYLFINDDKKLELKIID